ncbi:DUF1772 domain-containing protein [Sphingobium xenophagum]|uniref:DUF1772 domain-containing protein n=1 Tax=Sphingobium xenophagum TaxID=121428 RepID=UPI0002FD8175|nr:DUF1772 domain-containing protein [Sphingobium xenophagum]
MSLVSVIALVSATLFAGAALYISLVEHPARLALSDSASLTQWQPSYKRALPFQSGLAVAGGLSGVICFYLTADFRWLAGSIAMLANWPFTLFIIFPVNKRLLAIRPVEADRETRGLLRKWGALHNVRSALGAAAVLLFAWAAVTAG